LERSNEKVSINNFFFCFCVASDKSKDIVVVAEDIHISSENNRQKKMDIHLKKYFKRAEKFISGL